jgi:ParB family chromosome partitioning protein
MQAIPLTSLIHSKVFNVRKTEPKKDIAALKASIVSHGLQHNLIVLPVEGSDKFEVVAGGRRLAALKELVKEGKLPKGQNIECRIVDAVHAKEISLAENVVRTAMHPADQYEAWAKLMDEDGLTVSNIATRFGTSDSVVEQRLKMGRLSPVLMNAYRDEHVSLDALMAFTLCDDHARQEEVYKRFKDSYEIRQPNTIRQALTEKMVRSDNRLAKFVGVDAYEQAGGAVRRDLFSEHGLCYLDDVPLLQKLAEAKLQQAVTELQASWKWAEARESFGWSEQRNFRQIHEHELGEVPAKLTKKQESLERKLQEMEEREADESEAEPIQKQLAEVGAKIAAYSGWHDEEKAISGCIVTIGYDGDLDFTGGLVRPEDDTPAEPEEVEDEGEPGEDDDAPGYSSRHDESPDQSFAYSKALVDRLKANRLQVMRLSMAQDYETAFDAALYVMCMRDLNPSYYYGHDWLQVRANKYSVSIGTDDMSKALKAQEETLLKALPMAWLNHKDEAERWQAFCALSVEDKQRLFAACVARALTPQLSGEKGKSFLFDIVGQRLGVDVAQHWRPRKDNFLDAVTKKDVLAIGQEVLSEEWAKQHASKKKDEAVAPLDAAFANPDQPQFTPEQQERLKMWLPKGMAF